MSLSTARFETLKAKADPAGPGRSRPTTRPSPWEPGGALQSDPPLSYPGLHLLSSSASTGSSGHPAPGRGHSPAAAFGVDPRKDLKGSERQDELQATTFYPGKASGLGRPSALLLGQTACLGPPCGSGEGWRAGTGEAQWPGRADQGPMWENFGLGRGRQDPRRPHLASASLANTRLLAPHAWCLACVPGQLHPRARRRGWKVGAPLRGWGVFQRAWPAIRETRSLGPGWAATARLGAGAPPSRSLRPASPSSAFICRSLTNPLVTLAALLYPPLFSRLSSLLSLPSRGRGFSPPSKTDNAVASRCRAPQRPPPPPLRLARAARLSTGPAGVNEEGAEGVSEEDKVAPLTPLRRPSPSGMEIWPRPLGSPGTVTVSSREQAA